MKVERAGSAKIARKAAGYTRRGQALAPPARPVAASATVLGIPDDEFTPRVRDAVMSLMGEVEAMRQELNKTRARLNEMEKVADRDHLLPILNRRAFVRELTRSISFAVRYGTPASLLYFDLDGFKQVNDSHGHAAGDAVLEHFAEVLSGNVRDTDVVGRLGGDEFGVILSHANQAQAQAKAQSLADTLQDAPAGWQNRKIPIAFSYGAFELSSSDSADLAIARADEAMYAHKRSLR
ncbi:MAG TPA: GGDEF domain-containing protein [Rhizomicrobium sp.]|nr:GGDEF domain-containing protein [Rhizomicrobium sp.]